MDIKGGYAKPHWTDVLWVQLVILPLTVYRWSLLWIDTDTNRIIINFMLLNANKFRWTKFYILWLWRFGILREEYGRDEQLYVIRFSSLENATWRNFCPGKIWVSARVSLTSWRRRRWRRCLSWSCGRRTTLPSGKRRRRQKSGSRWLRVAGGMVFMCQMVFMSEIVFICEIHQVN